MHSHIRPHLPPEWARLPRFRVKRTPACTCRRQRVRSWAQTPRTRAPRAGRPVALAHTDNSPTATCTKPCAATGRSVSRPNPCCWTPRICTTKHSAACVSARPPCASESRKQCCNGACALLQESGLLLARGHPRGRRLRRRGGRHVARDLRARSECPPAAGQHTQHRLAERASVPEALCPAACAAPAPGGDAAGSAP